MAYEIMVGLTVSDDKVYQEYRDAMAPILSQYGGGFRFDFVVSKVLKTESNHEINRVFAIYFASLESRNAFFSHPDYKIIKSKYFERSVTGTTIIAEYAR